MPSNITFVKNNTTQALNVRRQELVENAFLFRRELLSKIIDPKRDIDGDCGYPDTVSLEQYIGFWERHGIAARVVSVFPEECWKRRPEIYETEKGKKTEFEKRLYEVETKHSLNHYMERIDIHSGIGHYGVLLLGINDGKDLEDPVAGIGEDGLPTGKKPSRPHELIYIRCFDEYLAPVDSLEEDPTNPRFGQPKFYTLKFSDPRQTGMSSTGATITMDKKVHWSRVIHVCDNRSTSEIIGQPRMKNVFNYLYDLKKVLSGSGEMFWKGGFPGYSFEVAPEHVGQVEIDKEGLRKEMDSFANSLQRYMALVGVQAKSLAPQVADPRPHLEVQMNAICISKAIPLRIFMGSEQAQLASTQDKKTWNERVGHRQTSYVTPMLVRPVIDRLILMGVLPTPKQYYVEWPEVFGPSDDEQATTAFKKTQSLVAYVASGAEHAMPPMEFFTMVMSFTSEEAEAIIQAAMKHEPMFDDVMDAGSNAIQGNTKVVDQGKKTGTNKGTKGKS